MVRIVDDVVARQDGFGGQIAQGDVQEGGATRAVPAGP
jgi:hypothetical protein